MMSAEQTPRHEDGRHVTKSEGGSSGGGSAAPGQFVFVDESSGSPVLQTPRPTAHDSSVASAEDESKQAGGRTPPATPATATRMGAGGAYVVHSGEHEASVSLCDEHVLLAVSNLHTGDSFEKAVAAKDLAELLPLGFPIALSSLSGFCTFMSNAFAKEAGQDVEAESGGASLSCVGAEQADAYGVEVTLCLGSGMFALSLPVSLELATKARATKEERHVIELRQLRADFGRQLVEREASTRVELEAQERRVTAVTQRLQRQLNLMSLQMNQRVFFGANHSVHIEVRKLQMTTPAVADGFQGITKYRDGTDVPAGDKADSGVFRVASCGCDAKCSCTSSSQKVNLSQVASNDDVKKVQEACQSLADQLYAADTETIMPLPSSALMPLQLCQHLESLSLSGPQINSIDFLANLPALAELVIDGAQVRDLSPLATLPALRKLHITNMDLQGGGEVDLEVLRGMRTLEEVSFAGSSAVSTISPLAECDALQKLDVTGCARVTDRRAFAANAKVTFTPQ